MKTVWFLTILSVFLNVYCAEDQTTGNLMQITKLAFKQNNICPDQIHQCSGSDPCCRTPTGIFTCCPYPYGSCCADGLHCCPYGMVCYQNITCIKANKNFAISKVKSLPIPKLNDVICKNGEHCPDGMTCCPSFGKEWGCCPLPNATCCSDKIHCCPHGTTCDLTKMTCDSGINSLPLL